ncbi:MAG: flagellar hook-length control protein FliK [Castellaniella sp.]|uniref:flagellar hook-length control protein FliK n=1 Tax=Castellaniella sp. TaxID=1955812 RepID=UPI003C70F29C
MNMPVLPVTSSSPPPADVQARGADAAATADTPAFSNVLSQQREGAARPTESRPAGKAGERADADATERHDPLGPDETLSLILDSVGLPLMQAVASAAETRPAQGGPSDRTRAADARTARLPLDTTDRTPAGARGDAQDAKAAEPDAGDRVRTPRIDLTAAAAPTPRTHPNATVIANPQEPGRARPGTAQFQPQAAGQTLAAQAAAGLQAAESTAQARPVAGLSGLQAATPEAALASAAAPAAAPLLAPAATPMPAAAPVAVATPLSNPQWPQDFSRQILQLTQSLTGAGHTVQMHVNPPELGPIHITLHVGESIAQASFVSPHASVRQALENALPHLEQQLAQAGLSLGQADVGDQQPGQQAQGQAPSARNGEAAFSLDGQTADGSAAQPAASQVPRVASRPDALVDTFA